MAAIKYWVWLSALRMRPRAKKLLFEHMQGDPEALYYADEARIRAVEGIREEDIKLLSVRELNTAQNIIEQCHKDGITILTMQDASYPERLKNIFDPPMVLYVKGTLPEIDDEVLIAVIGTRNASPYGLKQARKLGYDIAACGGVVISGLTRGIDRIAAEGALTAGGKVVGVLGTGLDEAKGAIYEDVIANGALISEYPPHSKTMKSNYRYRNRITSGLSVGVLVVEAPSGSGALLFADEALEQGKEIFALPGNVDAESCAGSNQLLKEGAKPVTNAWDVLEEYQPMYPEKVHYIEHDMLENLPKQTQTLQKKYPDFVQVRQPVPKKEIDKPNPVAYIDLEKRLGALGESQLQIIAQLKATPTQIDDLIAATGLDAATILCDLTLLELDGIVRQEPGKQFVLNII